MLLVRIEIMKGHDKAYKKAVMQAVHEGLMLSLGIPDEDRFQRLYEIDPPFGNWGFGGEQLK